MANPKWNYKAIMTAVVNQACKDIIKPMPRITREDINSAMQFLLSETCQCYCYETGKDYNRIREITAKAYRQKFPHMKLESLRHYKTPFQRREDCLQRFRNRFF